MSFNSSKITALKGDAGQDGTNGTNGSDGAAAGFGTPTITTGAAGSSASIAASGPDTAKVFAFTIPRGDTGATGPAGSIDLTADQTWTGSQRGAVVTDNDGSFDMSAGNNFKCTTSGATSLEFPSPVAGQSGFIILDNAGGNAISKNSALKADSDFLTTVSAAGTYLIGYLSDGTNTYITGSKALS